MKTKIAYADLKIKELLKQSGFKINQKYVNNNKIINAYHKGTNEYLKIIYTY